MKIYTRAGDDGTTGLLGPGRVPKHNARVEAYGTVDELNASLGVVRALDAQRWFDADLDDIQSALFQVGAELATSDPRMLESLSRIDDVIVTALEHAIDRHQELLPPLTRFVLPGGSLLAAHLHLARTICRRAERRVTPLVELEGVEPRLVRWRET